MYSEETGLQILNFDLFPRASDTLVNAGQQQQTTAPVSQGTMRSKKEYFLSSSTIRDTNALEHGQLENPVGMVQESCWSWQGLGCF